MNESTNKELEQLRAELTELNDELQLRNDFEYDIVRTKIAGVEQRIAELT